jgi:hypothetical protein
VSSSMARAAGPDLGPTWLCCCRWAAGEPGVQRAQAGRAHAQAAGGAGSRGPAPVGSGVHVQRGGARGGAGRRSPRLGGRSPVPQPWPCAAAAWGCLACARMRLRLLTARPPPPRLCARSY